MRHRPAPSRKPSLRVERTLQREGHRLLAGMDEVGRGALAGPVSVGVVVIDEGVRSAPTGIRDSKLLPAARRERLVAPVRRWATAWGVGHAGPEEIDAHGIMTALRFAGCRALAAAGVRPDLVVLDGNHDWLTDPSRGELLADGGAGASLWEGLPVRTVIKGDMRCSSVAAASILAKVERDALMARVAAKHPTYGWQVNKGYAAPGHRAALLRHGPCELHRRSWNLLAAQPDPSAEAAEWEPGAADEHDALQEEGRPWARARTGAHVACGGGGEWTMTAAAEPTEREDRV